MIDRIIGYDEDLKCPIYTSDLYPYDDYIGYEKENGEVFLF